MSVSIKTTLEQTLVLQSTSDSWRLDTELLLAMVLNCSRVALRTNPETLLTVPQQRQFEQLLSRRASGEPMAYILGKKGFLDFELKVDNRVLIPRPETELLVELALKDLQGREGEKLHLLDLGTGSGAIAIALAKTSQNWNVTAVDKSVPALALATENAQSLGLANIVFVQSNWCDALPSQEYDLIVSNPPYVDPADRHLLLDGLDFEPVVALVAENHGLAELMNIVGQAPQFLKVGALLLLEHGFDQARAVAGILQQNRFRQINCWQDLAGLDRVSGARKITSSLQDQ